MNDLGECLKKARIRNGVSLTEACEDLELSTSQLENIESGNVKAFKDVYELREYIRSYAKYLGLDSDKIADEFNGFLFEHTSKISLDDIKAAQSKREEIEQRKIRSPYTIEQKEKKNFLPIVVTILFIVLFILIIYFILQSLSKVPERVDELMGIEEEVCIL